MSRIDQASRIIAAPARAVYQALVEADSVAAWLPPQGMVGRLERFDPRPGGGFRMVLSHLNAEGGPGKTTDDSDVSEVEFVELVPGERVVQRVVFESEDPVYAGAMTMTWLLEPVPDGTLLTCRAADVPAGIDPADHEAGIASSLANLAAHVEVTAR